MSTVDSDIWVLGGLASVLLVLLGYFLLLLRRYKSIRGVMFGGKVERALGEVICECPGNIGSATMKLSVLSRSSGERLIGIEYVVTNPMNFEISRIVLSPNQAQRLSHLLQESVGAKKAT